MKEVNWDSTSLEDIYFSLWVLLEEGCQQASHSCHTPVFATIDFEHGLALRTVVLREVNKDSGLLNFHTHLAADKVWQIKRDNRCHWLFYDPRGKVQIRVRARATLHHCDDVARQAWKAASLGSRKCYCTNALLGAMLPAGSDPVSGLPRELEYRQPTGEESERLGWNNFMVVCTWVKSLEWLYLRAEGHRRALFVLENSGAGTPSMSWMVP